MNEAYQNLDFIEADMSSWFLIGVLALSLGVGAYSMFKLGVMRGESKMAERVNNGDFS